MREFVWTVVIVLASITLFGYVLGSSVAKEDAPVAIPKRHHLVCFDFSRNVRLNLKEYDIRFENNIIRFSNSGNEYAVYPQAGWMCSIVEDRKE